MRLHIYNPQHPDPVTVKEADPARNIKDHLTMSKGDHAFRIDDDGAEIDLRSKIGDIFSGSSGGVAIHPGRTIAVRVHYQGREVRFEVSPGTRVGAVRDKAIDHFGLDPAIAADLNIREIGATIDLPIDRPISAVAQGRDALELELVSIVRPQG